jgi:heptosyltransferase-2
VGDVVMATPALRALRRAHPKAEIVLEGRPFLEGLVRGLPSIDAFLADAGGGWRETLARAGRLRAAGFDWAVLLPDSVRAASAPFLAGIPVRVGYARDLLRRVLLSRSLTPPRRAGKRVPLPMTERYLRITRALGCPDQGDDVEIAVDAEARERVVKRLAGAGVGESVGYFVITPGASFGASKLWPPESYAQATDRIAAKHGLLPVLAPGPGEEELARDIEGRLQQPGLVLADPVTALDELVALLAGARLHLGGDTGPRQIAVALEVGSVVVMGPTDPRHSAHHLERQRVLREDVECSPCHKKICPIDHRCMTRLAPERVVAAAGELLT